MISGDRWLQIEPLLDAALDLPAHRREAFLHTRCGHDATLLAEVQALLAATNAPHFALDDGVHAQLSEILHEGLASFLSLPDVLAGRYRLQRELGHGGMAVVYLARDLQIDRDVALKVLRPEAILRSGRERFSAEIRLTSTLRHPHIVPLIDSGEADGWTFYVMPFIQGETLSQLLRRDGKLPVEEAIRIIREVLAGLEYAHAAGIVHRDVKPSNVMIADGHVLLADFGIARGAQGEELAVTDGGTTVGTPAYMSPEQSIPEAPIGPASDLYSAAAMLYELMVGRPPLRSTSRLSLAIAGVDSWKYDRPVIAKISLRLGVVMERAMAIRPEDRFPDASTFAAALQAVKL